MKKYRCNECNKELQSGESICSKCGLGIDGFFHGTTHIEIEPPKKADKRKFKVSHDRDVYEDGGSDED